MCCIAVRPCRRAHPKPTFRLAFAEDVGSLVARIVQRAVREDSAQTVHGQAFNVAMHEVTSLPRLLGALRTAVQASPLLRAAAPLPSAEEVLVALEAAGADVRSYEAQAVLGTPLRLNLHIVA
jgi:hypothetical protein